MHSGHYGLASAMIGKGMNVVKVDSNLGLQDAPPAKCWHCKGTDFWRGPGGQWLCVRCHPMPRASARLDGGTNRGSVSGLGVCSGK